MGRAVIDLTGQRFGRLVATAMDAAAERGAHKSIQWACACDCGNTTVVSSAHLRRGQTTSCGCERGGSGRFKKTVTIPTSAYRRWRNMLARCYDAKHADYENYGARGIAVCPAWRESAESFYACVGDPPFVGATLDREDNDGNYKPSNVRWATYSQQNRNRRSWRRVAA